MAKEPGLPPDETAFNMEKFAERFVKGSVAGAMAGAKATATAQAAELGYAFSTMQLRMDAQFAFVREVLKEAHPIAYKKVVERNGSKPHEAGDAS